MERTLKELQLIGGCFVFDFINTVNTRNPEPEHDYLGAYPEFLKWSVKAGLISRQQLHGIQKHTSTKPKSASRAFGLIIDVRENLYKIFSAIAAGKSPDGTAVNTFNAGLSRSMAHMVLEITASQAKSYFKQDHASLEQLLHPIMKSAFDILTMEDFERIKECPRCGWIFLDTSKNGKRRWCDMDVCGSREKSLEYYHRKTKKS